MSWKESFLNHLGTGFLTGVTFGEWVKLVAENRGRISPRYWSRALSITAYSLLNSSLRLVENAIHGRQIEQAHVPPPLFILGHWRSGTSHLHNLLALDDRFAFPTLFQVLHPHTFLISEPYLSGLIDQLLPETRMGVDNMPLRSGVPGEEEFALCAATGLSPFCGSVFPRREDHYERYLTFRDVSDAERTRWKRAFDWLMRKLSLRYGKPMVLKSPPHTGRVRVLL